MHKIQTDQADAIVVSPKVLERAFNIGERRVRQLAQEKILVKSGRGRYLFIDSVSNYITHLKANNDIKNNVVESEIDYEEEKALHERAKRIKAENELKLMENSLHEAADVESVMTDTDISQSIDIEFRELMLNEGSEALPVEPYTKNDGQLIGFANNEFSGLQHVPKQPPRTLPNGVENTDILIKVSNDIPVANTSPGIVTSYSHVDYATTLLLNAGNKAFTSDIDGQMYIEGYEEIHANQIDANT